MNDFQVIELRPYLAVLELVRDLRMHVERQLPQPKLPPMPEEDE